MTYSTKQLTRAAMIAAFYAALTLILQPMSFGPVQFRAAEALTLLPILCAEAIPGLAVGCLIANLLGGAMWYDVLFGTLATLLAAVCTRKLREYPHAAAMMPVIFNALIVGPAVYLAYSYGGTLSVPLLLKDISTVAIGEMAVCLILGQGLVGMLKNNPIFRTSL